MGGSRSCSEGFRSHQAAHTHQSRFAGSALTAWAQRAPAERARPGAGVACRYRLYPLTIICIWSLWEMLEPPAHQYVTQVEPLTADGWNHTAQ